MSGHSPTDSLQRLAPVSDSDAAAVFDSAGREGLLAGVTGLPFGRGARRRDVSHRRRLVLAVAVLALVATATAATWAIVRPGPARETTSVQCQIGNSDAVIPSTSGDPVQDCAADYQREYGTPPPRLVAYDNGLGGVTVITRGQKPQAGWKRLVSGQDIDLIQLQQSLDDYVNGLNSSCWDGAGATRLTQSRLAQFGFTGWTVELRDATSQGSAQGDGNTCWNGNVVDPSTETVTLIAASDQNGSTQTKLADRLRPIMQSCESLTNAVADVRSAAAGLGLSESARTYELNAVTDNSMRCASIYETVGGTIFLNVRGPTH